jgi:single-strand DNA-binding protein
MFNEAQLSLTGYVATEPRTRSTTNGSLQTSMRVAWTPRWLDRATGEWTDGNTNYLTVLCWRRLATNVATCMRKGDPVVVKGKLTVREYEGKDGVSRTAVEVDASSVGHDLSRGVAVFQRTRRAPDGTAAMIGAGSPGGPVPPAGMVPPGGEDTGLDEAALAALMAGAPAGDGPAGDPEPVPEPV